MALRWFATSPIYFNNVRGFNAGNLVPASIVQAHALDERGLVVQIDVDVDDPAVVLRPILTSDFDTDTERENFIPSRLSEVALKAAFVPTDLLVLSPTAPVAPVPGTVWINTAVLD